MLKKTGNRKKVARIRVTGTNGQPAPHLEMNYLIDQRIDQILKNQPVVERPVHKVVINFHTPCPHCGEGVTGEIIGRI